MKKVLEEVRRRSKTKNEVIEEEKKKNDPIMLLKEGCIYSRTENWIYYLANFTLILVREPFAIGRNF
jgi:hypothetical protein